MNYEEASVKILVDMINNNGFKLWNEIIKKYIIDYINNLISEYVGQLMVLFNCTLLLLIN